MIVVYCVLISSLVSGQSSASYIVQWKREKSPLIYSAPLESFPLEIEGELIGLSPKIDLTLKPIYNDGAFMQVLNRGELTVRADESGRVLPKGFSGRLRIGSKLYLGCRTSWLRVIPEPILSVDRTNLAERVRSKLFALCKKHFMFNMRDASMAVRMASLIDMCIDLSTRRNFTIYEIPRAKINIQDYVKRIQKYTRCSDEVLALALLYISDIYEKSDHTIHLTLWTAHKLIASTVLLALKFHEDRYHDFSYYAFIFGLTAEQLKALETQSLKIMNWKLFKNVFEINEVFRLLGL